MGSLTPTNAHTRCPNDTFCTHSKLARRLISCAEGPWGSSGKGGDSGSPDHYHQMCDVCLTTFLSDASHQSRTNANITRRGVGKPGNPLGFEPRDRQFKSGLPDHI